MLFNRCDMMVLAHTSSINTVRCCHPPPASDCEQSNPMNEAIDAIPALVRELYAIVRHLEAHLVECQILCKS